LKILIIGANGFIGSYVAEMFNNVGHQVIGWGRFKGKVKSLDVKRVNLLNLEEVRNGLIYDRPDIIIDCVGSADVHKSVENPLIDFDGNVKTTHNLLFALYKSGFLNTKVVFLSSAAVYGNPKSLPINENAELHPLSPYALHKVMAEDICRYFVDVYDMDIKILRIFSAYGIGLKKQIFWDMYNKAGKNDKLNMFGTGLESRDFINITDVVEAIFLITMRAKKEDVIFNVANGEEVLIKTAVEIFAENFGVAKEKIYFNGDEREGDPKNWKADISKLKMLGYTQQISIEHGIKAYVEWAKEF